MKRQKRAVLPFLAAALMLLALPAAAADKVLDTFEEYETDLDLSIYWSAYIDQWNEGRVSLGAGEGEGGGKGVVFHYDFRNKGAGILRGAYEDMSTTGDGISFWARSDTALVVDLDLAYDNNAYHYSKKLAFGPEGKVYTIPLAALSLTYGEGENNPQYLSHIMFTVKRDDNAAAPQQGSFVVDNVKYVNVQEPTTTAPTTSVPPPATEPPTPDTEPPAPATEPSAEETTAPIGGESTQGSGGTLPSDGSTTPAAGSTEPSAPAGTGNGWVLPVVITAVAVVLAGGGTGVYFYIRRKKAGKP